MALRKLIYQGAFRIGLKLVGWGITGLAGLTGCGGSVHPRSQLSVVDARECTSGDFDGVYTGEVVTCEEVEYKLQLARSFLRAHKIDPPTNYLVYVHDTQVFVSHGETVFGASLTGEAIGLGSDMSAAVHEMLHQYGAQVLQDSKEDNGAHEHWAERGWYALDNNFGLAMTGWGQK